MIHGELDGLQHRVRNEHRHAEAGGVWPLVAQAAELLQIGGEHGLKAVEAGGCINLLAGKLEWIPRSMNAPKLTLVPPISPARTHA